MPSNDIVELRARDLRLRLSPSIGGSICGFEWLGEGGVQPILRDEPRLARGERFDGHKIVFRKERDERRARE